MMIFSVSIMQYPKYLTVKEWSRFDRVVERVDGIEITAQEIICLKYEIILTDWVSKKDKIFNVLKKFNKTNLNKGLDKLDDGIKGFEKVMDEIDGELKKFEKEAKEFKI